MTKTPYCINITNVTLNYFILPKNIRKLLDFIGISHIQKLYNPTTVLIIGAAACITPSYAKKTNQHIYINITC
jgi:hypothetical protein